MQLFGLTTLSRYSGVAAAASASGHFFLVGFQPRGPSGWIRVLVQRVADGSTGSIGTELRVAEGICVIHHVW